MKGDSDLMKDSIHKKSNLLIALVILIYSSITVFFPIIIVVMPMIIVVAFFRNLSREYLLFYLFIGVVISGVGGPYLAIPGLNQLFLFRILMWVHIGLFLISKKNYFLLERARVFMCLMSCWIIYSTITLLWAENISLGVSAVYFQFESIYIMFFCIYHFYTWERLNKLLYLLTITYIITVFIGLYEVYTGWHLKYSSGHLLGYLDYRPTGMMVNTNDFAGYLAIYLSICSIYLLKKKSVNSYLITICMIIIVGYLIIESHSRTAFISFSLISCLLLLKCLKPFISFVIFYGLLLLIAIKQFYNSNIHMSNQLVQTFKDKNASTNERTFIYETILNLMKQNYFMGVGVGNTPTYVFHSLYGFINIDSSITNTMGAHNFWLSILSDVGFIGFLPVFLFFLLFFVSSIHFFVISHSQTSVIPLGVFIGFLGSSVGSSSIFEMRVIWIALGIGLSILYIKKEMVLNE